MSVSTASLLMWELQLGGWLVYPFGSSITWLAGTTAPFFDLAVVLDDIRPFKGIMKLPRK